MRSPKAGGGFHRQHAEDYSLAPPPQAANFGCFSCRGLPAFSHIFVVVHHSTVALHDRRIEYEPIGVGTLAGVGQNRNFP
jgi:hypothetical protein